MGVVNSTLEEVLVDAGAVMMGLDLASHVMAVKSEGTDVLFDVLDGLQGLHHLSSFVEHVLLHRHRLSRSCCHCN